MRDLNYKMSNELIDKFYEQFNKEVVYHGDLIFNDNDALIELALLNIKANFQKLSKLFKYLQDNTTTELEGFKRSVFEHEHEGKLLTAASYVFSNNGYYMTIEVDIDGGCLLIRTYIFSFYISYDSSFIITEYDVIKNYDNERMSVSKLLDIAKMGYNILAEQYKQHVPIKDTEKFVPYDGFFTDDTINQ